MPTALQIVHILGYRVSAQLQPAQNNAVEFPPAGAPDYAQLPLMFSPSGLSTYLLGAVFASGGIT